MAMQVTVGPGGEKHEQTEEIPSVLACEWEDQNAKPLLMFLIQRSQGDTRSSSVYTYVQGSGFA